MKSKRKEKEKKKKKRKEKKQREKGYAWNRTRDLRLTWPRGRHKRLFVEILLLKPSSLIKREFKDIFQKNDGSFDGEKLT